MKCQTVLLAAVAAALPLAAQAQPITGLYIGGGGGVNIMQNETDASQNGIDTPGKRLEFNLGATGVGSVGWGFGNGLRAEVELDYRYNSLSGSIVPPGGHRNTSGSEQKYGPMVNVLYDFNGICPVFVPYIGAGAGAARIEIADGRWDNVELRDRFDTQFAWQFGAGLAYELTPNWTASLDYRYLKTSSGASFDLFASNPNTRVETTYEAQSAILGLRYQSGAKSEPAVEPVAEAPVEVVPVAEPPPPPPPPECKQPAPGEPLKLDGCKAGDKLVLHGVNFEFDQAKLTVNAKTLLDQVVSELQSHPSVSVEVDGHTDSKGSDAYNQKLSERRAEAVRAYLVEHGVAADRLTAAGFGETQPIADNDSDEGREQNRRVELKIVAGDATSDSVAPPMSLSDTPEPDSAPVDPLAEGGSTTP